MEHFSVRKGKRSDLHHLIARAKQERFPIPDRKNTTWYVALVKGKVVGCGAVTKIGRRVCRLCSAYVLPKYRGSGIGRRLVEFRINSAEALILDVFAFRPPLFERFGFVPIRKYKIGTTYMRRKKR